MAEEKLSVLFLAQLALNNAQTVVDHVFAFQEFSKHNIFIIPWMGALPKELDLNRFDVIVIHYTVVPHLETYISPGDGNRIVSFAGLKVGFRQDEYQNIFQCHENIRKLGYGLFYTCIPEKHIPRVYPNFLLPGVIFKNTLTGFVPQSFLRFPRSPVGKRSVDIGYRARSIAFWLGDLSYEKIQIAKTFEHHKEVVCDTSAKEQERLYGKNWAQFLAGCKCTLGTESGASVLDFTGELEEHWNQFTGSPWSCEGVTKITYDQYRTSFLQDRQSLGIMNQISPRAFEAAALGTALILYEGEYSGILQPNRHFIPLKKNLSNLEGIVEKVKDNHFLQAMADRTHKEIACNPEYSYQGFIEKFDEDILESFGERRRSLSPYSPEEFSNLLGKNNYLDIRSFLEKERLGIEGYVRPFEIEKLPMIYGKKL